MDVDCDGANNTGGDCANDPSGQSQTAFMDSLPQYGINDLDANVHPYVVFGNAGFDPQSFGMEPLSVMAVVCNNQLVRLDSPYNDHCYPQLGTQTNFQQFYGVWGDTNGYDSTGEASIALAQMCFPNDGLTGDNGHGPDDVLYIGFTGQDAVPGGSADWQAGDRWSFEASIKDLGDRLVAGLQV